MTYTKLTGKIRACFIHVALLITVSTSAQEAQNNTDTAPVKKDQALKLETYVVEGKPLTGTKIRGIEPTGTRLMTINRDSIAATATFDTNTLLATVPQMGTFNTVPFTGANLQDGSNAFTGATMAQNLRGLPTLILFNGQRLAGAGILQSLPDVTIIPPRMLERVEIQPEGGSSIYGSDAISGVINLVTRKQFDGSEVAVSYGAADDFYNANATVIKGWDWGTGSAVVSYDYYQQSALFAKDRLSYYSKDLRPFGGTDQRIRNGTPGNILANGVVYKMNSGPTAGSQAGDQPGINLHEPLGASNLYPKQNRHSLYATMAQKISNSVEFEASAFWALRDSTNFFAVPGQTTGTITSTNPYFSPVGNETSHTVYFDLAPIADRFSPPTSMLEEAGANAEFKVKLGHDWQLSFPIGYSRSIADTFNAADQGLVTNIQTGTRLLVTQLAGTTKATALNPYDILKTDPAVLNASYGGYLKTQATQTLAYQQLVADGSIFRLPGGAAHLAIGTELRYEAMSAYVTHNNSTFSPAETTSGAESRNVSAAFSELFLPLVGPKNQSPLLHRLNLSVSARADHYSDIGSSINPKYGITYEPVVGLKFRASYGTAFIVPQLAQGAANVQSSISYRPTSASRAPNNPTDLIDATRATVAPRGGNPFGSLRPQRAKTYSYGMDWRAKGPLEGLTFSATFYHIDYTDVISTVQAFVNNGTIWSNPALSKYYIINPTKDQLIAFIGNTPKKNTFTPGIYDPNTDYPRITDGTTPYLALDLRLYNFGAQVLEGLDFALNYHRKTGFGSIDANFSGMRAIKNDFQAIAGAPFVDQLARQGKLFFNTSLGATVSNFTGRVEINYTDGYPTVLTAQPTIPSFVVCNLFFKYDLNASSGWARNTSVTLNVGNVFDREPTPLLSFSGALTQGGTYGRMFTLGLKKHF